VGHDPSRSPFRDITTTQGLTVMYGRFAGARTAAPVGLLPGSMLMVRLETRLAGSLDLYATFGQADSRRMQIFVEDSVDRFRGPIAQNLVGGDLSLILNLTGAKRWHAVAPYLGAGFGVFQASPGTVDQGGFKIGSNFVFVPTVGTRLFLGRLLAVRLEARDYWLRYEWPLSYFTPQDSAGTVLAPILPTNASGRQITHNFTLTAGLSYLFTF
jgi:hypothetical protein